MSKAKVVGVSTADILELQIGAQAQSQVILFFITGQSWQASLAVGCFPQPLQYVVSFERYHVVNWLCCWNVSGASEIQFQIPQGLCSNLMRRMNCMRRWRIHGDNIVGSRPLFPSLNLWVPFLSLV